HGGCGQATPVAGRMSLYVLTALSVVPGLITSTPCAPLNFPVPPTIGTVDVPSLWSVIGPRIRIVPWPWNVATLLILAAVALVKVYVPASKPTGWYFWRLPNSGPMLTSSDR